MWGGTYGWFMARSSIRLQLSLHPFHYHNVDRLYYYQIKIEKEKLANQERGGKARSGRMREASYRLLSTLSYIITCSWYFFVVKHSATAVQFIITVPR